MTALHLHQLDSKCLRRILSHLSLEELLKVRLVCMQFKVVVQRICQALCTLKIVAYPEALEDYPLELTRFHLHGEEYLQLNAKDTVTLPSLLSLSLLGELFSTVKHLVIYFGTSERSTCRRRSRLNGRVLCLLLEQWPNLCSLSLLGAIPPLTNTEHFRLSAAINGLSSLRRLNVFLSNLSPLPFTRLVPALSRLGHLSLFAYPGDISLVLRHLGPSIRHLSMQYIFPLKIYFILDELAPILLARPHLLSSITHLRLGKVATSTMLPFITGHFVHLQALDLEFDTQLKIHLNARLLMSLKWLQYLTDLRLCNLYLDLVELGEEPSLPSVSTIAIVQLSQLKCPDNNCCVKQIRQMLNKAFPKAETIAIQFK